MNTHQTFHGSTRPNSLTSRLTVDQLLDHAPVILRMIDPSGRSVYFNKGWYDYTGQGSDAALDYGWLQALHPDDRTAAEHALNSSASRKEVSCMYRLRTSDGEYRWMLEHTRPLYDGEDFLGLIGSITDVHDRKVAEDNVRGDEPKYQESEYRFRQLVDSLPLGLYITDPLGNISLVNPEMRRIWGQDCDPAAIVWSGAYKLYDSNGNELAPDRDPTQKAFIEQRAIEEEITVEMPDGERRHLICYLRPLFARDGSCSSMMHIIVDMTDRRLSEQRLKGLVIDLENRVEKRTLQLKQANDDLIRANYDLEQYAYIANHDLQEPLRKIRMFVDLASRNRHDSQRLDLYLNKIDASASRMSTLVKDVLNYSTLLMIRSDFVQVDLNETARKTLAGLATEIFIKNAKITVGSLPVVFGIDSQLLLLFNNIVANALTFTDESPAIVISAEEIDGETISKLGADPKRRYVKVEFKDNGVGFDEDYKDRIFDIFERLQTGGSHTGNGMGLPLCKRIVENHNGFITATSKRGSGSTFEVYLPSLQNNTPSV